MTSVLAIIPARGGSQRLPRKNLRELSGIPLVGHAILHAKGARLVNRIIVTTDDDEIGRVSVGYGAEVLKRPPHLAQGEPGSIINTVKHVLTYLEKYEEYKPLVVCLVQPTSPLRTPADIDATIQLMMDTGSASAETLCGGKENGAVYVSRRDVWLSDKVVGHPCAGWEMPAERSIDIDTLEDLQEAERYLTGTVAAPTHKGRIGWPKGVKRGKK
jgi:CMP-N-acetylneuraminic acid synthetase